MGMLVEFMLLHCQLHVLYMFVTLLTVELNLVFSAGDPAEIHQCRVSGPPREQE